MRILRRYANIENLVHVINITLAGLLDELWICGYRTKLLRSNRFIYWLMVKTG